ncbi:MAG: hypothetical protein M3R61_00250 [Chloroflexota bacterium]|nr:hypothetical protein [Chloroflexota bacterium]
MQAFIILLTNSEYGVEIPYADEYMAYISPDDARGGYFLRYCKDEMPPHATAHADTADQAAAMVAETVDLSLAREIEAD